jgi:hypothetical protein
VSSKPPAANGAPTHEATTPASEHEKDAGTRWFRRYTASGAGDSSRTSGPVVSVTDGKFTPLFAL